MSRMKGESSTPLLLFTYGGYGGNMFEEFKNKDPELLSEILVRTAIGAIGIAVT